MSRSNLNKAFIEALEADFAKHGKETLEALRADNPGRYLALAARLLPKAEDEQKNDDKVLNFRMVQFNGYWLVREAMVNLLRALDGDPTIDELKAIANSALAAADADDRVIEGANAKERLGADVR